MSPGSEAKFIVGGVLVVLLLATAGYIAHLRGEVTHERLEKEKFQAEAKSCAADKIITDEVSNGLQGDLGRLNGQLSVVRVQPSSCIDVAASSGKRDGTAPGREPARRNAVDSRVLTEFAGKAEKYRLQLRSCQAFIRKTWAAKGQ